MIKKALILVFLFLWLPGCAAFDYKTPRKIDLSYVPQSRVSALPGVNNVVLSVQINDQRKEKSNKVSSFWSRYGEEIWVILTNDDVTVTITQAIEKELKLCGFSIGSEASASIMVDLNQFWSSFNQGFFSSEAVAVLDMAISLKNKSGAIMYSRIIFTEGIDPIGLRYNSENVRLALNRAIENGMQVLFSDQNFLAALIKASRQTI